MSPTVHELRNRIRVSVGRFEREVNAQFTKEELAAIADAVGYDGGDRRPSKQMLRAEIRQRTGLDGGESTDHGAFTKPELEAIADALADE